MFKLVICFWRPPLPEVMPNTIMLLRSSEKTSPIVEPRPKVLISISKYFEFKMANPENTETCHGIGEGASSPPTILDPLVNIQDGMFAEMFF